MSKARYHHCDICKSPGAKGKKVALELPDDLYDEVKSCAATQTEWEPYLPMTLSTFMRHIIYDLVQTD